MPDATAVFYNTSGNGDKYIWNFGDGTELITVNPINPQHTYSTTGFYTVSLTVQNGTCADTLVCQNYIEVLYNSLVFDENSIKITPNPFSDKILVQTPSGAAFELTDAYGKLYDFTVSKSAGIYEIHTAALAPGVYFLRIETAGKVYLKKVVKL